MGKKRRPRPKLKFSKYFKREALGHMTFPLIFAIMVIICYPMIHHFFPDFSFITSMFWALFSGVAGVMTLTLTYYLVYKRRRR